MLGRGGADTTSGQVAIPVRQRGRHVRPGWPVLILAAGAVVLLVMPLAAMLWRAPWASLGTLLWRSDVRTSLLLSVECSLGATALAALVGLPLAWVLARWEIPGRSMVRTLVVLPMVMPPVVAGLALLLAFGRAGLIGRYLDRWFALRLPYTVWGAALSEAFVAMPFLVLTAEAGFRAVDRRQEDVARTLGARPWTVLRRVTVPLAAPSLLAGLVLCWARALGEFGATITFAGDSPHTETMPLRAFLLLQAGGTDAALAVSLLLVAASAAVLFLLRGQWWGTWRAL